MTLSVLHISDLHRDPKNPIGNKVLLDSLERDRDRYTSKDEPRITPPNFIIVSGDIVQGVKSGSSGAEQTLKRQYDEALVFLNDLTDRFLDGNKERIVVVPGNHDVSDDKFRQSLSPVDMEKANKKVIVAELLDSGSQLRWSWDDFAAYRIQDADTYSQRMAAFADFYNQFYDGNRSYSTNPAEQIDVFDHPDLDICVVGFCSCHNNDLLNRQGAVHPDCIAEAGRKLREITRSREPLRIAVWHHNTEGQPINTDYMDPDIVQNFIDGGFSLGFHGHQHRPEFIDTRFRHGINRRITVISAGTLCGGAAFRFGRAYNVVEIDATSRKGRLHLREMQNDNLQMPIWAGRSLPPNHTSYFDFDFDPPPEPFFRPNQSLAVLGKAESLINESKLEAAAALLSPLIASEPLARPILLECLRKQRDDASIVSAFDPPTSPAEAIVLMDALWAQGRKQRLSELLELESLSNSDDGAVVEMREKYAARLKK